MRNRDAHVQRIADELGVSLFAAKVMLACGAPGWEEFLGEPLQSGADAARFFNVSERTIRTWQSRGMPGKLGAYHKVQMLVWRAMQSDPEFWHVVQDDQIDEAESHIATGRALRAVFRVIRSEMFFALVELQDNVLEIVDGDEEKTQRIMQFVMNCFKPINVNDDLANQEASARFGNTFDSGWYRAVDRQMEFPKF